MRIASYVVDGRSAYGVLTDDKVTTASIELRTRYPDLRTLLEAHALPLLEDDVKRPGRVISIDDLKFLPVISNPDKVVCVGINYRAHAEESGRDLPSRPSVFLRHNNTLVAHAEMMRRPKTSSQFDFEGELAVIIGSAGRYIEPSQALGYVAGYTCFNDGSIRDYQKFSVTSGKNFPATGPLGPWMTTSDEIVDPQALTLVTRLNGVEMQRTTTDLMIYSVASIISFVSEFTPLVPGDVIATGTPSGIGNRRDPQIWMKNGDRIEVEISKIGVLRNFVFDE